MSAENIERLLFGEAADIYLPLARSISTAAVGTKYKFEDHERFLKITLENPLRANQIYWEELIGRAHLAGVVSVLRHLEWTRGMVVSAAADNFFQFAACLRGLIESVADTHDAVYRLPDTFASNAAPIERAIIGQFSEGLLVNGELEDVLIHFSHARKLAKAEDAPISHRAKQVREYLEILVKSKVPGVTDCYADLCAITHPSARSVGVFLQDDKDNEWTLRAAPPSGMPLAYWAEYRQMALPLFMYGFNGPLLLLATLNWFSVPRYHTSPVSERTVAGMKMWHEISRKLAQAK